MKRSLWFEAWMLVLVLIVATVGAAMERGASPPATASAQDGASTTQGAQHPLR